MRYWPLIASLLICLECRSNLSEHDRYDSIKNLCGSFNEGITDLAIVSYFNDGRQLNLEEVDVKVINLNNSETFPSVISDRGCMGIEIKAIKKIVIKSRVSNVGAAQPRENLVPGINKIELVPLTNDMFELVESCGEVPKDKDRLLIFKAINKENKELTAFTIDEANERVDFKVNDHGCVFIDNPPDSVFNINDLDEH